jgi:hypothetical protein
MVQPKICNFIKEELDYVLHLNIKQLKTTIDLYNTVFINRDE